MPVLLFFLWKRNWQFVGAFTTIAGVLAMISIAVVGPREAPATRALEQVVARRYLPAAVHLSIEPGDTAAFGERRVFGLEARGDHGDLDGVAE